MKDNEQPNFRAKQLIRFDWAMKKMLRDKANFDVLEGFLSELLSDDIKIESILESESNKSTEKEKMNRVDILVKNSKKELVIIEVQNTQEYDYLHRILFGTSKAILDHIKEGDAYASVKKVISITIAYFDLAQGTDYVYHGTTSFRGLHTDDVLDLGKRQKELYKKEKVSDIFPEYWLIKVSKFKNEVNDKLDEWVYFLKNGNIREDFSARGLEAAKTKLSKMMLTDEQEAEYQAYLKYLRDKASEQHTKMADAQELIDKALKKAAREIEKAEREKKQAERKIEQTERKIEQTEREKEQIKREKEQIKREKEQAEREKEQAEREKEQAERKIEQTEREKENALREKEQAERKIEQTEREKEQAEKALREKETATVISLWENKIPIDIIAAASGLTAKQVQTIIEQHQGK